MEEIEGEGVRMGNCKEGKCDEGCKHEDLVFCECCEVVKCEDCGKIWGDRVYATNWYNPPKFTADWDTTCAYA